MNSAHDWFVRFPIMSNNQAAAESASRQAMRAAGFRIGISEDRNKRYRRAMEDSHRCVPDFGNIERQGFFGIYDGHAGKATAEWCGENLHQIFSSCLTKNPDAPVSDVLNMTFLQADQQLNKNQGQHSGCTAVVAYVEAKNNNSKRVLYTANVGDARAVLCRGGQAVRLSYDHKGSDANEAKRIIDSGGFMLNNRVNGVLAVTRSLGDHTMKDFVVGNPYTTETELTDEDTFIILACDGLWDVCEDKDAVDLIKDITDPQEASQKLLDHALVNFSTDNLTIMVIKLSD
ncbi:mgpp2cl-1, protein phosphatase 2C-like protein 1 [Umbelopsis sp. WA50703]